MPVTGKTITNALVQYAAVLAIWASVPVVGLSLVARSAGADTQFLTLTPSYIPSFIGLGAGSYPEYLGADEQKFGVAPFGRFSWGEQRYVALEVNFATINLIEDRNWRAGPAGMWRFAREDVEDPVVNLLPDVSGSLELGGFAGYEDVGDDPRDRWSVFGNFTHGVTGDNDGYVVGVSARRWVPVGRFSALGFSFATSYGSSNYMDTYFSVDQHGAVASGLDFFDAGAGVRDVRIAAVYIQPLSREWQVGGGFLFSRLLSDAADTPIVSERGDRNQLVFGIGMTRAF
ncbi:MAG: MipA/OmpV family protein [Pseudomonadota bacterium]